MEIWKSLKGLVECGEYYEVSNLGNIRSCGRGKVKLRKLSVGTDGYLQIRLHYNKKQKTYGVHRLVAIAFIPNPNNLPEVNHIDKNRQNNNISNLEWLTHADNTRHSQNKKVKCYLYETNELVGTFNSLNEAELNTGITRQDIYKLCTGRLKKLKGYYFEWA